ncbi:MAG: hypothetical protein IKF91_06235 [Bacilli bacterium]|nr:hypothetical protein [Bacilli bacterium]
MFENEKLNEEEKQKKETYYPKDAMTEQEAGITEDMTDGQMADYIAENLSDY